MRVLIDNQTTELSVPQGQPLAQLVEQVRELVRDRKRVLANMTIDGKPIDAEQLDEWLARPADEVGEVTFQTACPRKMARQTIAQVAELFASHATALQQGAADKLAAGQTGKAMETLTGCLGLFKLAQEAVSRAVQLNRLDLEAIDVDGRSACESIRELGGKLADVKAALESRDLVLLSDLINYEFPQICQRWQNILAELDRRLAQ